MVSSRNNAPSRFANYSNKTEELNDWIRKVRSKKIVKKRASHGQDLRVLAVLSQALRTAEQDLRKKQEERAQKWAQIKMHLNNTNNSNNESNHCNLSDEEEAEQKRQIDNLWSSEFNGLNTFMKNLHQVRAR
uniref:CSON010233 protein n=1 Tax=Culicoides sonorensis TaxID=179676 RepID=A0A336KGX5_CULSO